MNIILPFVLALVAQFTVDNTPLFERGLLDVSDDEKPLAQELLVAIHSGQPESVHSTISKAMAEGHWRLVSVLLLNLRETPRQEAALALQDIKNETIARRLLEGWDHLDFAINGDDTSYDAREETRRIFERALIKQTGVEPLPTWTNRIKREVFAERIHQMYPKPPHP